MSPTTWPPASRALLAQGGAFLATLLLVRLSPIALAPLAWLAVDSVLAAALGRRLGLASWWMPLNLLLPWMLQGASLLQLPGGIYLGGFLILVLVFGGGLLIQVPLYHSNREAWRALEARIPLEARRFVDLGCGLGGPLAHLARTRPELELVGIEASPLTCLAAWLRCLPHPRVKVRLGSLWSMHLAGFDVVHAFLSPAPMARLWEKVRAEMEPGSLFLSHTFAVPGHPEDWTHPLPGREGACLRGWVIRSKG
ncbi:MAG: class I SAM-dependent methyltransferase [Acidobacteria bacterium]|nr:class I SAM-dependent methyltransferase [Acidobacteriota bacterium]